MSKGKQRPPQYNRQSKGYQQNMYKSEMNKKGVKMPDPIDTEKLGKINRIVMIVWVIVTVALTFLVSWKVGLALAVLGLIYFGGFVLYLMNYRKKYFHAYKEMGVTKEMYLNELRKRGTDKKELDRASKSWDKA